MTFYTSQYLLQWIRYFILIHVYFTWWRLGFPDSFFCSHFERQILFYISTCVTFTFWRQTRNSTPKSMLKQWMKLLNVIYAFLCFLVQLLFVFIVIKVRVVLVHPVILLLFMIFSYSCLSFLLMCYVYIT